MRVGRGVRWYAEVCRDVEAQGGRVCLHAHLKRQYSRLVKRQVESSVVRRTFRLSQSSSFRWTVSQVECINLIIPFGVNRNKEILSKEKGQRKVVL
jgi:hypothetical protein